MDGWMDVMDGRDGWMHGWIGGMDEWMGWMDGWVFNDHTAGMGRLQIL